MSQLDNEADSISFDLRPSDAINIAVRCKVIRLMVMLDIPQSFRGNPEHDK